MASLALLPNEILKLISQYLSNKDIKSFRLAGRAVADRVELRLERLFLSPSKRNIQVFRAVADHEVYRHQVKEIIWDDALLNDSERRGMSRAQATQNYKEECKSRYDSLLRDREKFMDWAQRRETMYNQLAGREIRHCRLYYRHLWKEQQVILDQDLDMEAFRLGLERFQNLSRVTITPVAHGTLFHPVYETPMIRAFPRGFVYPLMECEMSYRNIDYYQPHKSIWGAPEPRGFTVALGALATRDHSVKEFVVEGSTVYRTLHSGSFHKSSEQYENFLRFIKRRGLRRLDIVLDFRFLEADSAENRRLYNAFAEMTALEHIHFGIEQPRKSWRASSSALELLPTKSWPRLRHFGLSRCAVTDGDLVKFLEELPPGIQTIELNTLYVPWDHFHVDYRGILYALRDSSAWQARTGGEGAKIMVRVGALLKGDGQAAWTGDGVNKFLYENGPNPFEGPDGRASIFPRTNCGASGHDELFPGRRESPWWEC